MASKSNLKNTWKLLKEIINKKKNANISKKFYLNGSLITDNKVIAQQFNNFFSNIGPNLAANIPNSNTTPISFMPNRVAHSIFLNPVSNEEVYNIIVNLNSGAAGWDELSPAIIKTIKSPIICPLVHICNLSLSQGMFPNELKLANAVPIFKAGDDKQFTNYRPVSILPVFSKILERVMYNRLIDFLDKYKILYELQFGFRKGRSTEQALITLVDKVSSAIDSGDFVVGIFLDFSKAFDTVNHDILISKLEHYGIRGTALNWLKDYLNNRYQYVTVNSAISDTKIVKCGVPQGSILGPLLFLIYINDLYNVVSYSVPLLFADDTNLFFSGKNPDHISTIINSELEQINQWLLTNKLSLNISKTHYMIFSSQKTHIPDICLKIDGSNIERVYLTKFLGVLIDPKFHWNAHINYISKKLSKCIGILCKAKRILNADTLKSLYYTFAYPYLIYCNIVWGDTYQIHLNKLLRIQKKIIRIINPGKHPNDSQTLFVKLKLLDVNQIHIYLLTTFMYRLSNNLLSNHFNSMFTLLNESHNYNTRQAGSLKIPVCKTSMSRRNIRYKGVVIWNKIYNISVLFNSIDLFKAHIKECLLYGTL
jgi:hypothetical protein